MWGSCRSFFIIVLCIDFAFLLSLFYIDIDAWRKTSSKIMRFSGLIFDNNPQTPDFLRPSIGPFYNSPSSCSCRNNQSAAQFVSKDELEDLQRRRAEEYRQHQIRTGRANDVLVLAPPNTPLQYPIRGFRVNPMNKTFIPGLAVQTQNRKLYKVSLRVQKGLLSVMDVKEDEKIVFGQNEGNLTISSSSLDHLNELLSRVTYTSTIFHIKTEDLAYFSFENHEVIFPIEIRRQSVPKLYDPGKDINSQGWFAGRNLAVSQVTTKYFLWVDDDFVFLNDTRIERFVEVMEAVPELDVVGGQVERNPFAFTLNYEEGNSEEGGCISRFRGSYAPLPGFKGCFFVDGVVNYFLGRTDAVRKVGFDPFLKRVGHSEFFIDGLGELLVVTCQGLRIGHQKKTNAPKYEKYRNPPKADSENKLTHLYFKNHLKCLN
ncbi:beta-1,4 N-acetylgalactosaminyltransferase 2-like isoform X2 [Paramisgurnus dabryanus]|uniref:beta-1,4 N-acetylgalactosaminyltransferase 2-like isoform X2 n=1 Tax=Paramisgurnus dabryanus TaxID=90735 RepID=UPI0031F45E43